MRAEVRSYAVYVYDAYQILEHLKQMPEARYLSKDKVWRVALSPLVCSRLRGLGVEMCRAGNGFADQYDNGTAEKGREYDFGNTEPWSHQKAGADWLQGRYAGMLAYGMGAGKSLTTIGALAAWDSRVVLILCPRSVLGVWLRELSLHSNKNDTVVVLDRGSTKQKNEQVRSAMSRHELVGKQCGERLIVVVNYETAWREPLANTLLEASWDAVILDESHRVKSPTGRASKFVARLAPRAYRRVCLTGTPMPHSPLDIYAQMRFLEPALLGSSFARFRARYAQCDPHYPSKVLRWLNQDELSQQIDPWIRRVRTEDVVDLPPITHQRISFELSSKSQKIYDEMQEEMITVLESGEEVSAANALVQLLRLQQITSGSIDGKEVGTEKLDTFLDIASDVERDRPIVVFCRFRRDLESIRIAADRLGRKYGEISGDRRDLTEHAKMPKGVELMAVQQQSGGVGIDLTEASVGFWYSLSFSLGDYDQANARMHRPGQPRSVAMYHLVAKKTIDEVVYGALSKRRDVVEEVLDNLKNGKEVLA